MGRMHSLDTDLIWYGLALIAIPMKYIVRVIFWLKMGKFDINSSILSIFKQLASLNS